MAPAMLGGLARTASTAREFENNKEAASVLLLKRLF
jgi:hypothetical protein